MPTTNSGTGGDMDVYKGTHFTIEAAAYLTYLRPGYQGSMRGKYFTVPDETIVVDMTRPRNNWESALVVMAQQQYYKELPCLWTLRCTPWADIKGDGKLILIKRHAAVAETLEQLTRWLAYNDILTKMPRDNAIFSTFKGSLQAGMWNKIKDCPYAHVVPLF